MKFVIFDDEKRDNFYPLTLTRSTGDLRSGVLKLRQRILSYLDQDETNVVISKDLENIYKERHPDWNVNLITNEDTIFINSRLRINDELLKMIRNLSNNTCLKKESAIIAARCKPENNEMDSNDLKNIFKDMKAENLADAELWDYTWELIDHNKQMIKKDFIDFFYERDNNFQADPGVTIINPYNVWLGDKTEIAPGVIINAKQGPVIIDENAKIMENSIIMGPVFIGKKTVVKCGTKIYEGTSIGPVCKVGGEVEETIFQAYSNKQHDGFLGHSYLGEWVNIGAGTSNSDLKNNYQNVKSYLYPNGELVDTGLKFLGTIIGDHTKTAINTTINTGTVIGVACKLFGNTMLNNIIHSFVWGDVNNKYRLDKFFETAAIVKHRRGLGITANEKDLYTKVHKSVFDQ